MILDWCCTRRDSKLTRVCYQLNSGILNLALRMMVPFYGELKSSVYVSCVCVCINTLFLYSRFLLSKLGWDEVSKGRPRKHGTQWLVRQRNAFIFTSLVSLIDPRDQSATSFNVWVNVVTTKPVKGDQEFLGHYGQGYYARHGLSRSKTNNQKWVSLQVLFIKTLFRPYLISFHLGSRLY
jgi:hypothetical protein